MLNIKNGLYREKDGRINPQYYTLLESLDQRINNAMVNTKLSEEVSKNDLNELILLIYKKGLF